jgi:UDPglucose 6-dehydrogenase
MNEFQKRRFSQRIVSSLFNTVTAKKIALLGFAFKKDTGDTRAPLAITIADFFRQENAQIRIFDYKVPRQQILLDVSEPRVHDDLSAGACADTCLRKVCPHRRPQSKSRYRSARKPLEACDGADDVCILTEWDELCILTEWDEFKTLDWADMRRRPSLPWSRV